MLSKKGICTLLLLACSLCRISFAAQDSIDPKHSGKFALDLSQGIVFELFPWNAFSLNVLQNKNKFDDKTLVIGGVGQFDLQHWQGDNIITVPEHTYHVGNGFYFTQATLDLMANYTSWLTGFLSVSDFYIGQAKPDGNYIYLPRAFLLLGNLDKYPLYFTFGTNTIPFGNFLGSGSWDIPITGNYFEPQPAPQLSLGFYKYNINLSGTYFSDEVNHINHVAVNLAYNNSIGQLNYSIAIGHVNSLQTNATGNPANKRRKRVDAVPPNDLGRVWDVNASLGYKLLTLTGEYVTGSKSVIINNNNLPKAYGVILSFAPTLFGEVTTFGISRSASINLRENPVALTGQDEVPLVASGLKNSWAASVSRSVFFKNVLLGFDAVKDITYDKKQTFTYTLDLLIYL